MIPSLESLKVLCTTYEIDILTLSETWLFPSDQSKFLTIFGYMIYRRDRKDACFRAGGLIIYIKSHLTRNIKLIDFDPYTNVENTIEVMGVILNLHIPLAILNVYKPPTTLSRLILNDLNSLENYLADISLLTPYIICLGDFNIDLSDTYNRNRTLLNNFEEFFQFEQLIECPTRCSNNRDSLLDLLFVTPHVPIAQSGLIDMSHISDHSIIYCSLNIVVKKPDRRCVLRRCLYDIPEREFAIAAENIPWSEVSLADDIDVKVSLLSNFMISLFDRFAPLKYIKLNNKNAPWISEPLKLLIKEKNRAYVVYKKSNTECNREYYRQLRNACTFLSRHEHEIYIRGQLSVEDPKRLWSNLRKMGIVGQESFDWSQLHLDEDIMNNFFIDSIPDVEPSENTLAYFFDNFFPGLSESRFRFRPISPQDLYNICKKIKLTGPGSDGLSGPMVMMCLPHCFEEITDIINCSLISGCFPTVWKHGLVKPIPKKPHPVKPEDFRPITLLPFLSKILEKVCHSQLTTYFNSIGALPPTQSGFRAGFSMTTSLLGLSNTVLKAFDDSKVTLVASLDFSKAFDTINHKLLIAKCKYYGLSDLAIKWLSSYLDHRTQSVILDGGAPSQSRELKSGVPQGSQLGPSFFILYGADLPRQSYRSYMRNYADDTFLEISCFVSELFPTIELLNNDIQKVVTWSNDNALLINPNKTKFLIIDPTNRITSYEDIFLTIENNRIDPSSDVTILGLTADPSWRFDRHVSAKCGKAYGILRVLYPYRQILDRKLKLQLCDSLVLSSLSHANTVYGPCLNDNIEKKVQRVQNSCIRFSYGLRKFDHISAAFNDSQWLDMKQRWLSQLICLILKVISTDTPSYLRDEMKFLGDCHSRASLVTRHSNLMVVPRHFKTKFESSFSYLCPTLYNNLPDTIRNSTTKDITDVVKKFVQA